MTPEELKEILADPTNHVVAVEITPDDRERMVKASQELSDHMIRLCRGPAEAALVLEMLRRALYKTMGLRGIGVGKKAEHES